MILSTPILIQGNVSEWMTDYTYTPEILQVEKEIIIAKKDLQDGKISIEKLRSIELEKEKLIESFLDNVLALTAFFEALMKGENFK